MTNVARREFLRGMAAGLGTLAGGLVAQKLAFIFHRQLFDVVVAETAATQFDYGSSTSNPSLSAAMLSLSKSMG